MSSNTIIDSFGILYIDDRKSLSDLIISRLIMYIFLFVSFAIALIILDLPDPGKLIYQIVFFAITHKKDILLTM